MGNSKGKGNRGERRIVQILNERFKTDKFARVPNSGAFGTTHKGRLSTEAMRTLSGDLIVPSPDWVFSIEVKTGYDIDLISLFSDKSNNDKKDMGDFCAQSCTDASRTPGSIPMVIYTKDRREPLVALPIKNHIRQDNLLDVFNRPDKNLFFFTPFSEKFNTEFSKWKEWVVISLNILLQEPDGFFFEKGQEDGPKTIC